MCIQDSAAEFAGTMDSTAVVAEQQKSRSLLAEIDQPEMTQMPKQPWYYKPDQRGNH